MSYIDQGGVIMYILLALNILGFSVMIFKFFQILVVKSKRAKVKDKIIQNVKSDDKTLSLERAKDEINSQMISLESGLGIVKSIASIAPLLGLLGTVVGVLISFESISKAGMDDPAIFAGGISLALVTTVAGLIVAIPHYIGYNFLIGMLDRFEAKLISDVGEDL
ncbi:MAG: MotA/TolQ/ExbB proton channel family protein [Epsilonproteobacteria bacterium]|nr:MotA/TolQ/ExbB proton channel family protein [Campylobacterota bacterium]